MAARLNRALGCIGTGRNLKEIKDDFVDYQSKAWQDMVKIRLFLSTTTPSSLPLPRVIRSPAEVPIITKSIMNCTSSLRCLLLPLVFFLLYQVSSRSLPPLSSFFKQLSEQSALLMLRWMVGNREKSRFDFVVLDSGY